jgi:predicted O-methyltransferase YrrM
MSSYRTQVRRIPFVTRAYMAVYRLKFALSYFTSPLATLFVWVFRSRETDNFTYDLTPSNKKYLVCLLSAITGRKFAELQAYLEEIDSDDALRAHVFQATDKNKKIANADREARWGRRLGWYVLARANRPRVIIETGVDKGLGSCVLTAALRRNAEEGFPGKYFGTDLNPKAGYLLTGEYAKYGEILYGDSIESLEKLQCEIDLFINDSDHSAEYEAREYETITAMLSPNAYVLGDNAHVSSKLVEFALKTGRGFVYFHEKPLKHWYPGAGIGIAFPMRS